MRQRPVLRVFVSSPSDVLAERDLVEGIVHQLALDLERYVDLRFVRWENMELCADKGSFQENIDRVASVEDSHLVIGILWSRAGFELPGEMSRRLRWDLLAERWRLDPGELPITGTIYEWLAALAANASPARGGFPEVKLLRKTAPPIAPSNANAQERERWEATCATAARSWQRLTQLPDGAFRFAYQTFATTEAFAELVTGELWDWLRRHAQLPGAPGDRAVVTWDQGNPYRGLAVFEPRHAPVFCGRGHGVMQVLNALRRRDPAEPSRNVAVVVGMSGSGKSSLVRAGVIPRLPREDPRPGSAGAATGLVWHQAVWLPGDPAGRGDPLLALGHALLAGPALGGWPGMEAPAFAALAARDPGAAAAAVDGELRRRDEDAARHRLFLLLDQAEELRSAVADPAARGQAVALLDRLVRSGRVWAVATLRADCYQAALEIPGFGDLGEGRLVNLPPPTPAEVQEIIDKPAACSGTSFEEHPEFGALNRQIAQDALGETGGVSLPLLEFALDQLYQESITRAGSPTAVLTFAAYDRLGRYHGAIATHVQATMRDLDGDRLRRLVFPFLVAHDGQRPLRARVAEDRFPAEALGEVRRLIAARLLNGDQVAGTVVVTLAHEVLLGAWTDLAVWIDHHRLNLRNAARLATQALAWAEAGRGEVAAGHLLADGRPILEAEQVLADLPLEPQVRDFITASRARIEAARAESERIRRKRLRTAYGVAVAGVLLAAVAAGAAYLAVEQRKAAQANERTARQRLAEAWAENGRRSLFAGDAEAAALWLDQALAQGAPGPAPRLLASRTADLLAGKKASLIGHTASVRQLWFPGGSRLVSRGDDHTLRIWDLERETCQVVPQGDHVVDLEGWKAARPGTISADGRIWLGCDGERMVLLRDQGGRTTTPLTLTGALSPDGAFLVGGDPARAWPVGNTAGEGVALGRLPEPDHLLWPAGHPWVVIDRDAENHPGMRIVDLRDGRVLASVSGEGRVLLASDQTRVLWLGKNGAGRCWRPGTDGPEAVEFPLPGPAGETVLCRGEVLTYGDDGGRNLAIVDLARGTGRLIPLANQSHQPVAIAGEAVWTVDGGTLYRHPLVGSPGFQPVLHGLGYQVTAAQSPDGTLLAVSTQEGRIQVVELASGRTAGLFGDHAERLSAIAFAPGLPLLAMADESGAISLWSLGLGQITPQIDLAPPPGWSTEVATRDCRRALIRRSSATGEAAEYALADLGSTAVIPLEHPPVGETAPLACWSGDGRRLAIAGAASGTITVVDGTTGRTLRRFTGETLWVGNLADGRMGREALRFTPDGRRLLAGTIGGDLVVLPAGTEGGDRRLATLGPAGEGATVLDATDHLALHIDILGRPGLWDLDRLAPIPLAGMRSAPGDSGPHTLLGASWGAIAPEGGRVVLADSQHRLRLHGGDGRLIAVLEGHGAAITCGTFSATGDLLVTGDESGQLIAWDAAQGTVRWANRVTAARDDRMAGQGASIFDGGSSHGLRGLALSPDGAFVAAASAKEQGGISLWDAAQGRLLQALPGVINGELGGGPTPVSLAFAPGGLRIHALGTTRQIPLPRIADAGDHLGAEVATVRRWRFQDGRLLPRFTPTLGQAAPPDPVAPGIPPDVPSRDEAWARELLHLPLDRDPEKRLDALRRWAQNPHDPRTADETLTILAAPLGWPPRFPGGLLGPILDQDQVQPRIMALLADRPDSLDGQRLRLALADELEPAAVIALLAPAPVPTDPDARTVQRTLLLKARCRTATLPQGAAPPPEIARAVAELLGGLDGAKLRPVVAADAWRLAGSISWLSGDAPETRRRAQGMLTALAGADAHADDLRVEAARMLLVSAAALGDGPALDTVVAVCGGIGDADPVLVADARKLAAKAAALRKKSARAPTAGTPP